MILSTDRLRRFRLRYGFADGQTLRYDVLGGIESIITNGDGRGDNVVATYTGTAMFGAADSSDPIFKEIHVGQQLDSRLSADVFAEDPFNTRVTEVRAPLPTGGAFNSLGEASVVDGPFVLERDGRVEPVSVPTLLGPQFPESEVAVGEAWTTVTTASWPAEIGALEWTTTGRVVALGVEDGRDTVTLDWQMTAGPFEYDVLQSGRALVALNPDDLSRRGIVVDFVARMLTEAEDRGVTQWSLATARSTIEGTTVLDVQSGRVLHEHQVLTSESTITFVAEGGGRTVTVNTEAELSRNLIGAGRIADDLQVAINLADRGDLQTAGELLGELVDAFPVYSSSRTTRETAAFLHAWHVHLLHSLGQHRETVMAATRALSVFGSDRRLLVATTYASAMRVASLAAVGAIDLMKAALEDMLSFIGPVPEDVTGMNRFFNVETSMLAAFVKAMEALIEADEFAAAETLYWWAEGQWGDTGSPGLLDYLNWLRTLRLRTLAELGKALEQERLFEDLISSLPTSSSLEARRQSALARLIRGETLIAAGLDDEAREVLDALIAIHGDSSDGEQMAAVARAKVLLADIVQSA